MNAPSITLLVALLLTGLSAGLFFGWAVSVIPGTKRIDDRPYVETMQSINVAIVNPLFLLAFLGAAPALVVATIAQAADEQPDKAWWLAASTVIYVVGLLGVTAAGNIPLNNALAELDVDRAGDEDLARARAAYEGRWNTRHNVRTAAGVLALAGAGIAALLTPA